MKKLITLLCFMAICQALFVLPCIGQNPPYYSEVLAFKKQDSASKPASGMIIFTGSSSIRKWDNLQEYFPGYPVLNRGFGGSTLKDLMLYTNELVIQYKPKQLVLYSGENDLAASDTISAEIVYNRFKQVFTAIRKALPKTVFTYIAIKPSPSRPTVWERAKQANAMIKSFLAKQSKTSFVDVYNPMWVNGRPMPEIFLSDSLHMNPKGYVLWQHILEPYLSK